MKKNTAKIEAESTIVFESLESYVKDQVQRLIQGLLEQEVTDLLGSKRPIIDT